MLMETLDLNVNSLIKFNYCIKLNADSNIFCSFAAVVKWFTIRQLNFCIMDSVFCIISKSGKSLFEVCASEEVAREHLLCECYSILRDAGIEVEISERVVWK